MAYSLMYGLLAAGREDFATAGEALERWIELARDGAKWIHVIDAHGREMTRSALELLAKQGL